MKIRIALLSTLFLSLPVIASNNSCIDQAANKKLYGAAENSFIKKCVRDSCEATSSGKKLAGAAKNSFTKKCVSDGLQPYCESQVDKKNLYGAARTSFLNKCQAGN